MKRFVRISLLGAGMLGTAVLMAWLALWWSDRSAALPPPYARPELLADPGCAPCTFKGAGAALGTWLAERYAGSRVVVVLPSPAGPASLVMTSIREGFESSIAGSLDLVATVWLRTPTGVAVAPPASMLSPGGPSPATDLAELSARRLHAQDFDRALAEVSESYDLLVSLAGLPADWQQLAALRADSPPRLATLSALPEAVPGLAEGLRDGTVVVAVAPRLVRLPQSVPGNDKSVSPFDRQFLLVSRDNVDTAVEAHAWLFSSGGVPWERPVPPTWERPPPPATVAP